MAAIPFTAASKRIIRLEYIVVSDERPRLSTYTVLSAEAGRLNVFVRRRAGKDKDQDTHNIGLERRSFPRYCACPNRLGIWLPDQTDWGKVAMERRALKCVLPDASKR